MTYPAIAEQEGSQPKARALAAGPQPSLPAIVFFLWALLTPLFGARVMVNADGDPARHLRHGETILTQRDVIHADPFSFTRPGAAFVGFEYGSQVLLALAHRLGGTPGMVILATLVIAGTLAGLAGWLLRRGLDPLLVAVAVTLVAVLTKIHWLARPHVFSWPLMLLLLTMLEREKRPPLWGVGLLFAAWANLHGAFVFGWLMIAMYIAGHLMESRVGRPGADVLAEQRRGLGLVPVLVVATLATFVTPYGWRLPWHVIEFFRDPWLRTLTQEFQSPDFHAANKLPFLVALGATGLLLSLGRRPHWAHLVMILGNAAMALIAQRNIVQFGLLAVPILALQWGLAWDRSAGRCGFVQRFGLAARSGRTVPYVTATVALLGSLALGHGRIRSLQVISDGFDPHLFPVVAVAQARAAGLDGRVFHDFAWGGYLLWAWPEQKVFIDGGSDFYGGELLRSYLQVAGLQPGWADSLDAWRIDLVLTGSATPLAAQIVREPGWHAWHADSTATLFRRTPAH